MYSGDQTTKAACTGFFVPSPRTLLNMSEYRPDYQFFAVIAVRESYRINSHVSKDLQDGLLVRELGSSPMQG